MLTSAYVLVDVHGEIALYCSLRDEGAAHAGEGLPVREDSVCVHVFLFQSCSLLDQLCEDLIQHKQNGSIRDKSQNYVKCPHVHTYTMYMCTNIRNTLMAHMDACVYLYTNLRLEVFDIEAFLEYVLDLFDGISDTFKGEKCCEDLDCFLVTCTIHSIFLLCKKGNAHKKA